MKDMSKSAVVDLELVNTIRTAGKKKQQQHSTLSSRNTTIQCYSTSKE
jgi:hypothetical protein